MLHLFFPPQKFWISNIAPPNGYFPFSKCYFNCPGNTKKSNVLPLCYFLNFLSLPWPTRSISHRLIRSDLWFPASPHFPNARPLNNVGKPLFDALVPQKGGGQTLSWQNDWCPLPRILNLSDLLSMWESGLLTRVPDDVMMNRAEAQWARVLITVGSSRIKG